jgi:LysR family transcriptional regulator, low CO2-responsive transcriptional regulator
MKRATLRQLRILAAVVAEGSFSAAAKSLHLTQPAVSQQVKELEGSCGLPLLERAGKHIRLTEAGGELMLAIRGVERELKSAEDSIAALKGLRGGLLTVAVISTAQYFAPRLLTEFCRRHSGVKLRLDVCNRDAIIGYLERDDIDLAIMGRPPAEIATAYEPFASNPHVVIAPPGHRLARRRRISLEELLREPFIAREPGSGTRQLSEQLFDKRGHPFAPTLVMNSNETIKQAVIAGMGVSLLSLHTLGLEITTGTLAVLDVAATPIMRRWYLVHRKDKRLSPVALAFHGFMLAEAASFVETFMEQGRPRPRKARRTKAS